MLLYYLLCSNLKIDLGEKKCFGHLKELLFNISEKHWIVTIFVITLKKEPLILGEYIVLIVSNIFICS